MAEIKIEKKKSIWPYIIIAAVVALLIYLLAANSGDDKEVMVDDASTSQPVAESSNNAVASYLRMADSLGKGSMGLDHAYSNAMLLGLIDAVEAKAGEVGFDLKADMDKARQHANHITREPYETSHADKIRLAAETIAGGLHNLQQAHFPALDSQANNVKAAAQNIDPAKLTLDQKGAVQAFYESAATLLQQMNS